MNKIIKNTIALSMVVINLLPCLSVNAESVTHTEWSNNAGERNLMVTADSGLCGDNMKWTLDDSGTLTISGDGEMYSYVDFANDSVAIPWFEKNNAATINRVVVENGVESISDMAFYGTSISSLELPNSVKSIGMSSIANCQNLTIAILSDSIAELPEGTFNSDSNLAAVVLPKNLNSIGESAFIHCYKLKDIVIPASVTDIKDMAFFDCPLLNEVVIPDKMTTIKRGTFQSCNALKSVIFPQNLTKVEQSAFSNCANLEEIILPDGLTEIGQNAFSYSKKDRNSDLSKQKVYVPKSVKTIEQNGIDSDSVIYGFKNSIAEKYAVENKIDFVEVTESLYDSDSYDTVKTKYYSKSSQTIKETITLEPTTELSASTLTVYSGKTITVSVGSKTVTFPDAQPFIDENNRTQIPIRAVVEMLDCTVDWNGEAKAVTITHTNGDTVRLTIDSNIMTVNGKSVQMDTAAIIKDERTYIPVRFVAEAMGLKVIWTN